MASRSACASRARTATARPCSSATCSPSAHVCVQYQQAKSRRERQLFGCFAAWSFPRNTSARACMVLLHPRRYHCSDALGVLDEHALTLSFFSHPNPQRLTKPHCRLLTRTTAGSSPRPRTASSRRRLRQKGRWSVSRASPATRSWAPSSGLAHRASSRESLNACPSPRVPEGRHTCWGARLLPGFPSFGCIIYIIF